MATKLSRRYDIYLITNSVDDYWYVGSASGKNTAAYRFKMHCGGHGNARLLYAKIQELGSASFTSTVLEVGHGDPIKAEERWYQYYLNRDPLHTLNMRSPSSWGEPRPHTPEELQKMSDARQGYRATSETCQKMSDALKGRKITWGDKISAAKRGHHHTDETKALLRAQRLGVPTGRPPTLKTCADCGVVYGAPSMGRHSKATGHRPVKS